MNEAMPFGMNEEQLAALPTVFRNDLFKDKIALVSGAGSGLGKAIATLLGKLGAKVLICGRNAERLQQSEKFLRSLGVDVLAYPMTIRDPEQVGALFDLAQSHWGGIDILVNNAGGQFPQAAIDFKVKGWNAVIDTNLNGTWYMMQTAAQRWVKASRPGNIINIVAVIWRGMPGIAHTCAARAGVIYLSKTLAVEWAPYHIRVNCVAPGVVETEGFNVYPPEGRESFHQSNPMRRTGDVQDVAEACAYLAAPSGKFITGEILNIDGGQQMWGDPWPAGRPDYFKP